MKKDKYYKIRNNIHDIRNALSCIAAKTGEQTIEERRSILVCLTYIENIIAEEKEES